ncbi:MAG: sodium:calcium antiporter [Pirellulales bacterium]
MPAMLIWQFLLLAGAVAAAGSVLARSADQIAEATGLGRLLVGSLLLAAVTSLPELSVDIAAIRSGYIDLAAGDLFGSSLMNLLILAIVDLSIRSGRKMLSREGAAHALSATLGIAVTSLAGLAIVTADKLPAAMILGMSGWSWAILLSYFFGARMIFINQRISARLAAESQSDESGLFQGSSARKPSFLLSAIIFGAAAVVLCFAGPKLAHVAGALAEETGLGGTFVGTTLVAVTTSLPELVASLTAIRIGAIDLAIGNAFGSNAFNIVLFVPLDFLHEGSIFLSMSGAHAVTAFTVVLATAIAVLGQLYHGERRLPFIEPDAFLMLFVVLGGLFLIYSLG